ncbi:MAG: methyltransferase domain-containing protein [Chitinophaga sp.]|uniref:class I SAM-dependent methyltransferase n=1 Tax=Chitinophaga sp. TaxID=1869181 RepID=UPI001B13688F|nr:class I SAM-dependent methyltransferase [Chitinophaga sp.]MBO9729751.1 methyltransferase domain-containing protein [Chitinophaga sp.]
MSQTIADFYNRLYFLYPVVNYFLKRQKQVLFEEVNKIPAGKLLEIGVGTGSHLSLYKAHQVTGIDISTAMLDIAKLADSNATLLLMNGEQLSFPDACFDYVVVAHVLAVTANPDQLLDEVYRVLKPAGKLFVLNHFTPDNPLKWIDWLSQPLCRLLHVRSFFHVEQIQGFRQFTLCSTTALGTGAYYKLFIFHKP